MTAPALARAWAVAPSRGQRSPLSERQVEIESRCAAGRGGVRRTLRPTSSVINSSLLTTQSTSTWRTRYFQHYQLAANFPDILYDLSVFLGFASPRTPSVLVGFSWDEAQRRLVFVSELP